MIRAFARNLRNDVDAVIQGLTSPFSSGVVEGRVKDLKSIKKQMAGRRSAPGADADGVGRASSVPTRDTTTGLRPHDGLTPTGPGRSPG